VNRLNGLVNSLLALATLNKNSKFLKIEKINLNEILIILIKKFDLFAKEKNIKIKNTISKNIFIRADKEQLFQLLNIVLDNATKYADKKSSIKILTISNNKFIKLIIENRGESISQKDLPYIFDRFYRVSKDRNKKGYGLGLAIAKNIINKQGGRIEIQSENKKTKVIIEFKK
jgi:signal transduction histidine kinase